MARKAASSTGAVVYEKKNQIDLIKYITHWVCNNKRRLDDLDEHLQVYRKDNTVKERNSQKYSIFKRVVSYCYSNPQIVWYINKYLNKLYDFGKFDIIEFMNTLVFIMDAHGHNNSKKLFYLKSNDLKDDNKQKVKSVLKNYFINILNRTINDNELNSLYFLFTIGAITESDIIELDKMVNGGESKLSLSSSQSELTNNENQISEQDILKYIEHWKLQPVSTEIQQFCNELKELKQSRKECQNCKLFKNPMVVLDTNMESFGEVDFAFFALNPGSDEVVFGKPLVGRAGQILRRKMAYFPNETRWVLSNTMLCSTPNQKDIGKNDKEIIKVVAGCQAMVAKIMDKFPAKFYIPVGSISMQAFNISGSITSMCGEILTHSCGAKMIPLIHPSALLHGRGGNTEKAFDMGFDIILNESKRLLGGSTIVMPSNQNHQSQTQSSTQLIQKYKQGNDKYYLNDEKMVSQISDNLTLFDVTNLDGYNVLLIFIDENGNKKYQVIPFNMPIFINDTGWGGSEMLKDDCDSVIFVNGPQRHQLLQAARDNLNLSKKIAINRG